MRWGIVSVIVLLALVYLVRVLVRMVCGHSWAVGVQPEFKSQSAWLHSRRKRGKQ